MPIAATRGAARVTRGWLCPPATLRAVFTPGSDCGASSSQFEGDEGRLYVTPGAATLAAAACGRTPRGDRASFPRFINGVNLTFALMTCVRSIVALPRFQTLRTAVLHARAQAYAGTSSLHSRRACRVFNPVKWRRHASLHSGARGGPRGLASQPQTALAPLAPLVLAAAASAADAPPAAF